MLVRLVFLVMPLCNRRHESGCCLGSNNDPSLLSQLSPIQQRPQDFRVRVGVLVAEKGDVLRATASWARRLCQALEAHLCEYWLGF